jgi:GntR family transcriptional regulator, arabinose operon transcriptional repressor
MVGTSSAPKHRQVYEALLQQIVSGGVKAGGRLPSEADLVQRFGASRITVARALRDLQAAGLIERRAGSGTYVRQARRANQALSLGMVIPDFGDVEVFTPIYRGMLDAPEAQSHALVWTTGTSPVGTREDEAWQACQQCVARRVDGVFFAPLELTPNHRAVNRRIADAFAAARIPVVLLDRSIEPYPQRGRHDLVGLDNRRAGALVTSHLLNRGCQRVTFIGLSGAASSVDAREAGFREALALAGLSAHPDSVLRGDPSDTALVDAFMRRYEPDGILCASDRTAGALMRTLLTLGYDIPGQVRMGSIDDVEYASLLPVPLTTLRQPCREIGIAAMSAMVARVAQPDLPPRDMLLHGQLIVRASSGT